MLPEGLIKVHDLTLDTHQHKLSINNQEVPLSILEYKLLFFFISNKNRTYSREQLLDHVWGRVSDLELRSVDVQVRRLRDKLKPYECDKFIHTKRGLGYVFKYPTA